MTIKLTIKMTPEASTIAKRLSSREYKRKLDEHLEELSKRINENIQAEAPVKTGNLYKSHRQHKLKQFSYEGYVDARTKASGYFPLVIKGTAPHIIKPRIKKALHWPGLLHPVRIVHHPGTKPNDYVKRGLDRSNSDIRKFEEDFGTAVEQEVTG